MNTARTGMTAHAAAATVDTVPLHLLALAPAAVGLCCLAADGRRARAVELAAALLMIIAMADAAVTALVPAALWAGALIAGAMLLAVTRGRARALAARGMGGGTAMPVHAASGMLVMAALLLATAGGPAATIAGHHHSAAPALTLVAAAVATAYVVASAVLTVRARGRLVRAQFVAMAASVGLMSLGLVG